MTGRRALAGAASAIALAMSGAAAPADALPAAAPVLLRVDGSAAYTPFATVAGEPYLVTITGVYTYNGTDLADCGHWQPPGGGWEPGAFVQVDGHPAACVEQPYNDAHTYQWTEIGTGRPFEFTVWDAGHADNVGGFVVTVAGARAQADHRIGGTCGTLPVRHDALDYVPVTVQARADTLGTNPSISTYLVCDVTSTSGESAHLRLGVPGPFVATAGRLTVPRGDVLTICWSAGATWDDGVEDEVGPSCSTRVVT